MSYNEQVIYTCKHCEKDKISEPVGQVVLKIPCPGPTLHDILILILILKPIGMSQISQKIRKKWKIGNVHSVAKKRVYKGIRMDITSRIQFYGYSNTEA